MDQGCPICPFPRTIFVLEGRFCTQMPKPCGHQPKGPCFPLRPLVRDRLCDQGRYAKEANQQRLPVDLLTQTATAALAAWRSIPAQGSLTSPLTKILQVSQEGYSEFVGSLVESAERIFGTEGTDSKFIKQLAYENANAACCAALRGSSQNPGGDDQGL